MKNGVSVVRSFGKQQVPKYPECIRGTGQKTGEEAGAEEVSRTHEGDQE